MLGLETLTRYAGHRELQLEDFSDTQDHHFFSPGTKHLSHPTDRKIVEAYRDYVHSAAFNPQPMREFLAAVGIHDLQNVNFDCKNGVRSKFRQLVKPLGVLTGLWSEPYTVSGSRKALIEKKILESQLEFIPHSYDIVRSAIEANKHTGALAYFDVDIVGQLAAQNKRYTVESGMARKYLQEVGITDLRHLSSSHTDYVRMDEFFSRFGFVTSLWKDDSKPYQVRQALLEGGLIPRHLDKLAPNDAEQIVEVALTSRSVCREYFIADTVRLAAVEENRAFLLQSEALKKWQFAHRLTPDTPVNKMSCGMRTVVEQLLGYKVQYVATRWTNKSSPSLSQVISGKLPDKFIRVLEGEKVG